MFAIDDDDDGENETANADTSEVEFCLKWEETALANWLDQKVPIFQCYDENDTKFFIAFYSFYLIRLDITNVEMKLCKPAYRANIHSLQSIIVDHSNKKRFVLIFKDSNESTTEKAMLSESTKEIMQTIKDIVTQY